MQGEGQVLVFSPDPRECSILNNRRKTTAYLARLRGCIEGDIFCHTQEPPKFDRKAQRIQRVRKSQIQRKIVTVTLKAIDPYIQSLRRSLLIVLCERKAFDSNLLMPTGNF